MGDKATKHESLYQPHTYPRKCQDQTSISLVRTAVITTFGTGMLFTMGALLFFDFFSAIGVFTGAALATANLFALKRIFAALVTTSAKAKVLWGLFAVLKFVGLLLIVGLLLCYEVVEIITLIIGYASLPIAIGATGVVASRMAEKS